MTAIPRSPWASQARDAVLAAAVGQNSKDIRKSSEDIGVLRTRVEALGRSPSAL